MNERTDLWELSNREREIITLRREMEEVQGVYEGRKEAISLLRQASGDAYALGDDEQAFILRDIANILSRPREECEDQEQYSNFAATHNSLVIIADQSDDEYDRKHNAGYPPF